MKKDAMQPYGNALLDYQRGFASAVITVIRDDGKCVELPASAFFRPAGALVLESRALDLCRGKILDVGAGTGIHSLFLQEKGFVVQAIDILPEAVQIMIERGVKDIELKDMDDIQGKQFDTVLMMGHGIGIAGDMNGLGKFLNRIHKLLAPNGQVLLTSVDIRCTKEASDLAYQKRNAESGIYFGEIRMQFKYDNRTGPLFKWLHVDAGTLAEKARAAGWRCEVVEQQSDGNYLARIF